LSATASNDTELKGWPFFAPSAEDAIEAALDLAGLKAGDHFVDLGCGDGQVLVAAARRGARVTGVEYDRTLARAAQATMADAGVADRGEVVVGDLFDGALWRSAALRRPDVLFSYLSPAMLQRLTPYVQRLQRPSRFVTVDFLVPDLRTDETRGPAHLYRLPGRRRRPRPSNIGWPSAGTLCVMPPEVHSLTSLDVTHPGGPVTLTVTGALARHGTFVTGTDSADRGRPVAVDIRWRERDPGTLAHGILHLDGLPPHPLTVLFAEDDQAQWELADDGVEVLAELTRPGALREPITAAPILHALDVV
jgi:SAM-dependent methyltransferase